MVRNARKKSLRQAMAKATAITETTGRKVLIYFVKGQYEVITKQSIRHKWHNARKWDGSKRYKGYTVAEMEAMSELIITKNILRHGKAS